MNKQLGGLNFAECIIYSLNFGDIYQLSWENTSELLLSACKKLESIEAEAIVLCANTAHMHAEFLQKNLTIPIIHIGEETANVVQQSGIKKIGLMGTKFTMEMDFYRKKLEEKGLLVLIPEEPEIRNFIQTTLRDELGKGLIRKETKEKYLEIINSLVENGAEGIILGCTEIPLIIGQEDVAVPVFDTTRIHSEAAIKFILT